MVHICILPPKAYIKIQYTTTTDVQYVQFMTFIS